MIINNICLSWFDETWIQDASQVKQGLLAGILQLDNAGVNKIVIACNTVHVYYDFLQQNSAGNIINLILEVSNRLKDSWHAKVLILWSSTTYNTNLYDEYLHDIGISYYKVTSREQSNIDNAIKNVMWWCIKKKDKEYLLGICKRYKKIWVTSCIVWCTELPFLVHQDKNPLELFDTLSVLTDMVDSIDKL